MEADLYAVICEGLDVLIEDFDSGDIGLPIFASKVERILGNASLYDTSNAHGFEWTVLDQGRGYDLYYASDTHRALMQIRLVDGNRYVHALIKHEDSAETGAVDTVEDEEIESVADSVAVSADDTGCGDPNCPGCSAAARIKAAFNNVGLSVNVLRSDAIPEGTLLSFGRLKRDEN
jgi:hypothetical protein